MHIKSFKNFEAFYIILRNKIWVATSKLELSHNERSRGRKRRGEFPNLALFLDYQIKLIIKMKEYLYNKSHKGDLSFLQQKNPHFF